ncbi:MAG: phosphotransferase family protein [Alphaproteobacteria bacterium]
MTQRLPQGIVEEMVRLAYPNKKLISQQLISGGCANLNFKIHLEDWKDPLILRVYLRDKGAAFIEQKIAVLLKETVPVPTTYYIGEQDGYYFAITEFMYGISLRDLLLGDAFHDIADIMYQVGTILSKITAHKFSEAGFFYKELNIKHGFGDETINRFSLSCLKHHNVIRYLDKDIIDSIERHLERLPDFINNSVSLVHADFDPANILVDKVTGSWAVTGVLDWEFAYSGFFYG